jgi:hypothetical protein
VLFVSDMLYCTVITLSHLKTDLFMITHPCSFVTYDAQYSTRNTPMARLTNGQITELVQLSAKVSSGLPT